LNDKSQTLALGGIMASIDARLLCRKLQANFFVFLVVVTCYITWCGIVDFIAFLYIMMLLEWRILQYKTRQT